MNFDFGGTLRRAWQITWQHKILWLFGLLSALGGGRASFNARGPNFSPNNFNPSNPDTFPRLERLFPNLDQNVIIAIAVGILCVGLIIVITLYVLHVIGRGGLIGGIQLADTTGQVSFGQAWGVGVGHFWTVLLIGLIVAIIGFIIAIASVFAAATVCLLPLACLGFLVIAVLGVFTYLAQIAAVTENLSFGDAIGRALQIVQTNLGTVVLMGIILVIIESVVAFLILLPLTLALAPIIAAGVAIYNNNTQAAGAALAVSGLCLVLWIPVLIVLRSILETWVVSNWTLTYKQLSAQPGQAAAPAAPAPMAS